MVSVMKINGMFLIKLFYKMFYNIIEMKKEPIMCLNDDKSLITDGFFILSVYPPSLCFLFLQCRYLFLSYSCLHIVLSLLMQTIFNTCFVYYWGLLTEYKEIQGSKSYDRVGGGSYSSTSFSHKLVPIYILHELGNQRCPSYSIVTPAVYPRFVLNDYLAIFPFKST